MKHLITGLVGGAGLSALSLVDTDSNYKLKESCKDLGTTSCPEVELEASGFPFSFINEHQDTINSSKAFISEKFELAPALANFVFWALVAVVAFKILGWAFEKLSMLAFVGVIALIAASYFGLVQIF